MKLQHLEYTIRVRFQRPRMRTWRERLLSLTPWRAVEWYDQPADDIADDFEALAKWLIAMRDAGQPTPTVVVGIDIPGSTDLFGGPRRPPQEGTLA